MYGTLCSRWIDRISNPESSSSETGRETNRKVVSRQSRAASGNGDEDGQLRGVVHRHGHGRSAGIRHRPCSEAHRAQIESGAAARRLAHATRAGQR